MCKSKNTPAMTLGVSTLIGTRPDQQDSVYAEILEDSVVAVLCDGMGGLDDGAKASQSAIQTFAEDYERCDLDAVSIPEFLKNEAIEMDMVVHELKDEEGNELKSGTTVSATIIRNGALHWLSVGDSRIYIIRGDEIMAANRDHNYRLRLDQYLKEGRISEDEYKKEESQADALISFLGMGSISLMDINTKPFELMKDDIIIICSDGLYRSLSEEEIMRISKDCLPNTQRIADVLTETAIINSLDNQDNTSVVVLHYVGE